MKIELAAMAQREPDDHGLPAQALAGGLPCIGRKVDVMSREGALGLLFLRTVAAAVWSVMGEDTYARLKAAQNVERTAGAGGDWTRRGEITVQQP